jgi:hypothetical protein
MQKLDVFKLDLPLCIQNVLFVIELHEGFSEPQEVFQSLFRVGVKAFFENVRNLHLLDHLTQEWGD